MSQYQSAVKKLEAISPAVLDKAFQGGLVEQDSSEESAIVLLERIRAEKTAKPRRIQSKRTPKKMPKMTKKYVKEVISHLPRDTFLFNELQEKLSGEYDVVKDIIFALLDESEPVISQVFDQEAKLMQFVRRDK